jgi:hypothetical protein
MLSNENYEKLLVEIKNEFCNFEIIKKPQSTIMKCLNIGLKIITLGLAKDFMSNFITTINDKVYVPDNWDSYSIATKAITLRHERIHMRQARKFGKIVFSLAYLLFPLPVIFASFRMKMEKEGYEESIKAYHEYYGTRFFTQKLKQEIISNFTTARYFWMWPWKTQVEKWYDDVVKNITN